MNSVNTAKFEAFSARRLSAANNNICPQCFKPYYAAGTGFMDLCECGIQPTYPLPKATTGQLCPVCGSWINSQEELYWHLRSHTEGLLNVSTKERQV